MASAMAPALAGSQTAPRLALGSATMILRMVGKSLPTTGVPAARHSNSLLGDESRSFNVSPGFGITPRSALATSEASPTVAPGRAHRIRSTGSGAGDQFQLFTLVTLTHQDEVNVFEALERDRLKEELNAATFGQSAVIQHHRGRDRDARRLTDQGGRSSRSDRRSGQLWTTTVRAGRYLRARIAAISSLTVMTADVRRTRWRSYDRMRRRANCWGATGEPCG